MKQDTNDYTVTVEETIGYDSFYWRTVIVENSTGFRTTGWTVPGKFLNIQIAKRPWLIKFIIKQSKKSIKRAEKYNKSATFRY